MVLGGRCVCVYISVCLPSVSLYIHVCMGVCIHLSVYLCTLVCVYKQMCLCVCECMSVCMYECVYLCTHVCECVCLCVIKAFPLRLALSNFQIVIMSLFAHCGDKIQNVMNYFIITIKSKLFGRVNADVACDLWWLVVVFILAGFGWLRSQSPRRLLLAVLMIMT
jgi:hypothetical protein